MPIEHVDPAPAAYVGAILTAVRAFDQLGVADVLDDAEALHGLGTTIDEVAFPALRLVGMLWSGGTMDIAHEHVLSVAVARWVGTRSARPPGLARAGTILLAAGPQDLHTLPLDCLTLLLADRGVEVCNLGAQTPTASLLVVARSIRPTAVVLSSQNPTIGSEAVRSVEAMAEAGLPVYVAGASFVLQVFRQRAPGLPLDATMRASAEMLTARHTTPLPAPAPVRTGRRAAEAVVSRAVAVAREVQAAEAAASVVSTRRAVDEAALSVGLAARQARADRSAAARLAADAVVSSAGRAAGETAVAAAREAGAAAQVARTVEELDVAIEREVAATAAEVRTVAEATARQVAADTFTRAADLASVARDAVLAARVVDRPASSVPPRRPSLQRWQPSPRRARHPR
jgi:methylmalonyl-CoA mutase cobalamin-binding subunit